MCDEVISNPNCGIGSSYLEEDYKRFLMDMIHDYTNWLMFCMAKNKNYPNIMITESLMKNIYSYLVYFNPDRWDVESVHPNCMIIYHGGVN